MTALQEMGFNSLGHDVLCGAVTSTQSLEEAVELLIVMGTSEARDNNDNNSFRLEEKHFPDLRTSQSSHTASPADADSDGKNCGIKNLAGNQGHRYTSSRGQESSVADETRSVAGNTSLKRRRDKGFVWVDTHEEEHGSEPESVAEDDEWVNLSDMEVESCGDSDNEDNEASVAPALIFS